MTIADPLVGATLDGRYYVESRIAGGGMATVYVAQDLRLDRRVALKVMHASLAGDPVFVQRFINEAHSVAKLSHPNVVQVYDQGTDKGHVYLAMEYVPGRSLRGLVKSRQHLSPNETLQIMVPVLAALGAAHRAGMVHRDVKPENVLLTEDGHIKVVDFGLARVVETTQQNLTKTGTLMGTAAYLAPEQISDNTADARSDVYAAGILLYELLTGRQPHQGETTLAVAYQHVNTDVPAPSAQVSGIGPQVDALVARATQRDPQQRPADAAQFLTLVFEANQALPQAGPDMPLTHAPSAAGTAGMEISEDGSNHTLIGDFGKTSNLEQQADSKPKRRKRYPLLILAAVLAVAVLAGGWWMLLGRYESVPEMVGQSEGSAQELAAQDDLGFKVADKAVYDDSIDPGQVAKTAPEAGERILAGETVTVFLSKGAREAKIPEVVDKPVDEAKGLLKDAGFTDIKEEKTVSFDKPAGTVVSVTPGIGEKADREKPVTLKVSAGFDMPSVVGLQKEDARKQLEESGLAVEVSEREDAEAAKGEVIEQNPESGSSVATGDSVTIVVSSGPKLIEIPDLGGMKAKEAKEKLKELGFKVKVEKLFGSNKVDKWSPKEEAEKGATITIWTSPFAGGGPQPF